MPAKKDDKEKEPETQSLDEIVAGLPDQIRNQVDEALDARIEELRTEYRKQADETLTKLTDKLEESIEEEVQEKVKEAVSALPELRTGDGEFIEAEQLPAIGESITYVIHELDTGHFREFAAQVTAVGSDGTTISLTYFAPNARAGRPVQLVEFGPGDGDEPRETYWRYPELTGNQVTDQA